ncbi:MAG: hypothetical protein ACC726_15765 [Chloroflexota bacterium]
MPEKTPWVMAPTYASGTPWVRYGDLDAPLPTEDVAVIRELATKVAEIAALPVQQETIRAWKDLNALRPQRPMVQIDEVPWHELGDDPALRNRCTDILAQSLETSLCQTLYQWEHMRCDMVVEPYVDISKVIDHPGFGLAITEHTISQGAGEAISSHQYLDQIPDDEALAKLRVPEIELDAETTEKVEARALELVDGILDVRMQGLSPWFSMWDDIEMLRGAETILYDLVDRPEFLVRIAERMTDIRLAELDILEEEGLLGWELDRVHCVGAHTDELPKDGFDVTSPRAIDNWVYGMAQLFVSVSYSMWAEMELPSAIRYYGRFGLGYYGCCEPLHDRIEGIRQIPNVRKISMSAWSDIAVGAEAIGPDYVFSRKPNPALVAMEEWVPALAEKDIRDVLEVTRANGCPVEITLKDISTCRRDPRRLWEWAEIATRLAHE